MNEKMLAFRKFGRKKGYWNSGRGPIFYFKHELFPNIDFNNKTVLDIGSGKGVFCGIASLMGAKKVVGLEPEQHGSTSGVLSSFEEMKEELNMENIFCFPYTFQEYEFEEEKFDLVLMHASINHLNEDLVTILHKNEDAKIEYMKIIKKIHSIMNTNGRIVIMDCARGNLSTFLGFKRGSKYNRTIEWEKHQNPNTWIKLFENSGFKLAKKSHVGESTYLYLTYLLKNKFASYIRWNKFILMFDRK